MEAWNEESRVTELIVFGYTRSIQKNIPTDLIRKCLVYYDDGQYFVNADHRLKIVNYGQTVTKYADIKSWILSRAYIQHIVNYDVKSIIKWTFCLNECCQNNKNVCFILMTKSKNENNIIGKWRKLVWTNIGDQIDITFTKNDNISIILDLIEYDVGYQINEGTVYRKCNLKINKNKKYNYMLILELFGMNDCITIEQIEYSNKSLSKVNSKCFEQILDHQEIMKQVEEMNEAMSQPLGVVMDDDELEVELAEFEEFEAMVLLQGNSENFEPVTKVDNENEEDAELAELEAMMN